MVGAVWACSDSLFVFVFVGFAGRFFAIGGFSRGFGYGFGRGFGYGFRCGGFRGGGFSAVVGFVHGGFRGLAELLGVTEPGLHFGLGVGFLGLAFGTLFGGGLILGA